MFAVCYKCHHLFVVHITYFHTLKITAFTVRKNCKSLFTLQYGASTTSPRIPPMIAFAVIQLVCLYLLHTTVLPETRLVMLTKNSSLYRCIIALLKW